MDLWHCVTLHSARMCQYGIIKEQYRNCKGKLKICSVFALHFFSIFLAQIYIFCQIRCKNRYKNIHILIICPLKKRMSFEFNDFMIEFCASLCKCMVVSAHSPICAAYIDFLFQFQYNNYILTKDVYFAIPIRLQHIISFHCGGLYACRYNDVSLSRPSRKS